MTGGNVPEVNHLLQRVNKTVFYFTVLASLTPKGPVGLYFDERQRHL